MIVFCVVFSLFFFWFIFPNDIYLPTSEEPEVTTTSPPPPPPPPPLDSDLPSSPPPPYIRFFSKETGGQAVTALMIELDQEYDLQLVLDVKDCKNCELNYLTPQKAILTCPLKESVMMGSKHFKIPFTFRWSGSVNLIQIHDYDENILSFRLIKFHQNA